MQHYERKNIFFSSPRRKRIYFVLASVAVVGSLATGNVGTALSYALAIGLLWWFLKRREARRQRAMEHVNLKDGGWVDLSQAALVCRWTAWVYKDEVQAGSVSLLGQWRDALVGPGVARWKQGAALYRTTRGGLILKAPVGRQRMQFRWPIPFRGPTVGYFYEYKEVKPLEAVSAMVQCGATVEARRLFPDEYEQYQVIQDDQERGVREQER
jgi:hypothetical protein